MVIIINHASVGIPHLPMIDRKANKLNMRRKLIQSLLVIAIAFNTTAFADMSKPVYIPYTRKQLPQQGASQKQYTVEELQEALGRYAYSHMSTNQKQIVAKMGHDRDNNAFEYINQLYTDDVIATLSQSGDLSKNIIASIPVVLQSDPNYYPQPVAVQPKKSTWKSYILPSLGAVAAGGLIALGITACANGYCRSGNYVNNNVVWVDPYTAADGTFVQGHYRTSADGNIYNNWSTYPNINPYTGQPGYIRP